MKTLDIMKWLIFNGDDEHTTIWVFGAVLFLGINSAMHAVIGVYELNYIWDICEKIWTPLFLLLGATLISRILVNMLEAMGFEEWIESHIEEG